ncbi:MAG: hypothetical protein Q4B96_04410 [Bacillota bacterium]|nr:hypothetical protein [Bacillota bacterium]
MRKLLCAALGSLLLSLLFFPAVAFAAAEQALALWWQVIAPALLPFFILSELLLASGAPAYLGRALTPLMQPLFNLPGAAAIAVALGFCSGFPTGALLTAALRRDGCLSRAEAERLLAFTNNAGPLYIVTGVSTGLFGCPQLALLLAPLHYGGNLLLGVALGRLARHSPRPRSSPALTPPAAARPRDLGAPGVLLKTAAQKAVANIALIGCYMVLFAVLTAMLGAWRLLGGDALSLALTAGLFEMSIGIDQLAALPLAQALPWTAALLAWGGLSVQAQVAAMVAGTDIRLRVYLLCRVVHAALSLAGVWLVCRLLPLPLGAAAIQPPPAAPQIFAAATVLALLCAALLGLSSYIWQKKRRSKTAS